MTRRNAITVDTRNIYLFAMDTIIFCYSMVWSVVLICIVWCNEKIHSEIGCPLYNYGMPANEFLNKNKRTCSIREFTMSKMIDDTKFEFEYNAIDLIVTLSFGWQINGMLQLSSSSLVFAHNWCFWWTVVPRNAEKFPELTRKPLFTQKCICMRKIYNK